MTGWQQRNLVEPVEELLALVPVGDEVRDRERCERLALGVEGVFRSELGAQYAGWPPESTTDGSSVDLCVRSSTDTLDVVGLMWIDFGDEVFPYRAEITRAAAAEAGASVSLVGYIGQIDPRTGRPPRLPAGTLVVPVRDDGKRPPTTELIVGRRQVPIVWKKVLEWR
jgi:hypothetical protein